MQKEQLENWQQRADASHGAVMKIVTLDAPGHEVLRRKAKPVRHVNRMVRGLLARMEATMYDAKGVGLAAPQVGVSLRLIVADAGSDHCALVNPEVVLAEGSQRQPMEGCLSIPGVTGEVERAERVRVHALDPTGHEVWIDAEGYFARVLQHEIDHLDGILFTDRATRIVHATPESKLKIVFCGSSTFGAEILDGLLAADITPQAVVTQPDRPAGRGMRLAATPVRSLASTNDLTVLTPEKAKDPDFQAQIAALKPDVLVTAAYGQMIPTALLTLPRLGAINVHPSLLPRYRGADPIRRALWNGDVETGVTILYMTPKLDAGDILAQERLAIASEDNGETLAHRLAQMGSSLLRVVLHDLALGKATAVPQDERQVVMAPKITPAEQVVNWSLLPDQLVTRARSLAPHPGLGTPSGLKLLEMDVVSRTKPQNAPGEMTAVIPGEGIQVATGGGQVLVRRVQPPGKRPMMAWDYVNGHRLQLGERLE